MARRVKLKVARVGKRYFVPGMLAMGMFGLGAVKRGSVEQVRFKGARYKAKKGLWRSRHGYYLSKMKPSDPPIKGKRGKNRIDSNDWD